MWFTKLWVLIFPAISMGFRWDTIEFAADYFKQRNVPCICLISCGSISWDVKFTQAASARFISVSRLDVNNLSNKNTEHCFRQFFSNVGVLMNAQCTATEQILYTASERKWFDFRHIWLYVDETTNVCSNTSIDEINEKVENSSRSLQIFKNLNLSVDADIILALRQGNQFQLFDVFNFGKEQGGNMVVTEVGTSKLKKNEKLIQELNKYKYYRRWDFNQSRMRMISVATSKTFDPEMLTSVNDVPGVVTITRTSTTIFTEVAKLHNIKFVHTSTEMWIGSYERNTTRAASTSLYFREQDLTSVFRFLESLLDRVTVIHPALTSIESRYYYRIPTTGPGKFENQFLRPLTADVWYCLLLMSVLCIVIMVCASRLEARPMSFQYALFSVTASVCQQYFEDDASANSVRRISGARKLTMLVTGVACVLIYNYYTSSVVSWLLNGPPPSINSLEELLESPLELIFQDAGYIHSWLTIPGYYFSKSNAKYEDIIKRKVLSRKRSAPIFVPVEQGIAMVKTGGYAYLTEPFNANNFISQTFDQNDLCELDSLTSIKKTLLYPGLQKNSPYKEFFTWSLTRMLERGIVSCIQRRTAPLPVACEGSSPRALALGGAAPAFILLASGYLLAIVIMFLEKIIYKIKQSYQQN